MDHTKRRLKPSCFRGDTTEFVCFTMEQRDKFLEQCRQTHPSWYAYFVTAFHTGMRVGELAALRWENVDFQLRSIRVAQNVWRGHVGTPKSNKPRSVPMNRLLWEVLSAHKHAGQFVFPTLTGGLQGPNAGAKVLKSVCRKVGLQTIRRHDMRHTFATILVTQTRNLPVVKELLGHADFKTTLRYAHYLSDTGSEAVEALVSVPSSRLSEGQNGPIMVNSMVNSSSAPENPSPRNNKKARKIQHLRALRNESG